MNPVNTEEKSVRLPEVMRLVGMSRSWIYREIKLGNFPPPAYRFGTKKGVAAARGPVSWSLQEIMRWLELHRVPHAN